MTVTILQGDVFARLKDIPDASVHCIVTSPPYWGLREYQAGADEIGREPTFHEHLDVLRRVFDDLYRVLRRDGVAFLNYGDTYARDTRDGLKPKDLIGLPWRLAQTLQQHHHQCPTCGESAHASKWGRFPSASRPWICPNPACHAQHEGTPPISRRGWFVRNDVIWWKSNTTPESARDRFTCAHEYVFVLSKQRFYFWDGDAVKTPAKKDTIARYRRGRTKAAHAPGQDGHRGAMAAGPYLPHVLNSWASSEKYQGQDPRTPVREIKDKQRGHSRRHEGFNARWDKMSKREQMVMGAMRRDVWQIAPFPLKYAHWASFPPRLVEILVKCGTSAKGACAKCGKPYKPLTRRQFVPQQDVSPEKGKRKAGGAGGDRRDGSRRGQVLSEVIDWEPACKCDAGIRPCVVLDPFGGSGTVGMVADELGRDAILIELVEEYIHIARERISPMFTEVA